MQPNLLRADGGEDELPPAEVWAIVDEIGYSHHFIRYLAVAELEGEGVWPINSSSVKRRVQAMTGAETPPTTKSVLTSMRRFEKLGALEREELTGQSGDHWTPTDLGRQLGHGIAVEWCRMFGFDEAVGALVDDSTDSDE